MWSRTYNMRGIVPARDVHDGHRHADKEGRSVDERVPRKLEHRWCTRKSVCASLDVRPLSRMGLQAEVPPGRAEPAPVHVELLRECAVPQREQEECLPQEAAWSGELVQD
ncbi:hypothetical protein BN946_scf184907.g17 [Trametes cinnabarina]|uniref:Uncharacterized protein n=1 Tax=Pycnoporus cinnabarinus TaxID=5643 RepID=A0A060SU00_PYCCI|nr:hypothetical protein BN946_scf184907.g17 [Trametes cinnabarina]